jgi:hypothetical protein
VVLSCVGEHVVLVCSREHVLILCSREHVILVCSEDFNGAVERERVQCVRWHSHTQPSLEGFRFPRQAFVLDFDLLNVE